MAIGLTERSSLTDRDRRDVGPPRRWLWLLKGFRKYVRRYLRKHFHAVRLSRSGWSLDAAPPGPLLIVLNHPAWWDPLICMVLSQRLADRDQFAAIDAVAVQRYGFFKKLGFIGVDTKTLLGAAEFVRMGQSILSNPGHVYWVTAQGRFSDVRERPLNLQTGVGHLAARMSQGTVVSVALEYVFWSESTPEALMRVGEPHCVKDHPGLSGKEWTALLERSLTGNLDRLSAESITRDPNLFLDLLSGKTGVGGVYDLWRRLKAWAIGRRFDPSHDSSHAATPE